jgi:hypothetical protein
MAVSRGGTVSDEVDEVGAVGPPVAGEAGQDVEDLG